MNLNPTTVHAQKGFTLVETLVAITILMIAITGPYYAAQQAILSSYSARDELIASSLAQEGAEYIYFMRDNNYLTSQANWLNGMDACMSGKVCTIDPSFGTLNTCINGACPVLNLDSSTGLYNYGNSGTPTRFTRSVSLQQITPYQEQVTVSVTWITVHRPYTITVVESIYNWI